MIDGNRWHAGLSPRVPSCWVKTTSRWGIKQLGVTFGSIFLPFSNKSSRGVTFIVAGGNPWLPPLNDSHGYENNVLWYNKMTMHLLSQSFHDRLYLQVSSMVWGPQVSQEGAWVHDQAEHALVHLWRALLLYPSWALDPANKNTLYMFI